MDTQPPWSKDFWSGFILEFGNLYSDAQTQADADFLVETLAPAPGARFLDVPCGEGRIAHVLAERGFHVTGVDFTPPWLAKAARIAQERGLTIAFEQRDMRDLPWDSTFDHAYCFGNSFSYFPHQENAAFLRGVHKALKPGGSFVLQTNFCIESFHQQPLVQRWKAMGESIFLHQSNYHPATGQLISDYINIRDGQIERKQATYQTYTYRELWAMFEQAGFTKVEGYGSQKREPFQLGSMDLFLVGVRT